MRNLEFGVCPLSAADLALERGDVVATAIRISYLFAGGVFGGRRYLHSLIEDVERIPIDNRLFLVFELAVGCRGQVRSSEAFDWPGGIRDGKGHVILDVRLLALIDGFVSVDGEVGHLRVKVRRVAHGSHWRDIVNGGRGRVGPRVKRMLVAGLARRVGVAPPEFEVVLLVDHHRVRARAPLVPAVASHTGMAVLALPWVELGPLVLAVDPRILLKRVFARCVPEVDGRSGLSLGRVGAGTGHDLAIVGIAVEVAFPARLETDLGRVVGFEVLRVERSGFPLVGLVALRHLLHVAVLANVENMELDAHLVSTFLACD